MLIQPGTLLARRRTAAPAPVAPVAALLSIDASGEFAQWDGTPPADPSPYTVTVQRAGYDATGAGITWAETIRTTVRARQQYPNQALLTASQVALSQGIYSTDSVVGVTNNSTLASPKPLFAWTMLGYGTIGNTHRARGMAWHVQAKAGAPVACVRYTWSDGTNSVSVNVSTVSVRTDTRSGFALLEYDSGDVNLSTLTNGEITLNAQVFPHVGVATFQSSGLTDYWDQRPLYFRKHPTIAATPPIAYVSSTGSDGTGAVSTSDATAKASPYLTPGAALTALRTFNNANNGVDGVDGCRLRLADTAAWVSPATGRQQLVSAYVVEPSTDSAGRMAWAPAGGLNFRAASKSATIPEQSVILRRMALTPGHTGPTLSNSSVTNFIFDDCDLDFTSAASGTVGGTSGRVAFQNCHIAGCGTFGYFVGASPVYAALGCTSGNLNAAQLAACNVQACRLENARILGQTFAHQFIAAQVRVEKSTSTSQGVISGSGASLTNRGMVLCNFEAEECASTERNWGPIAPDGVSYNSDHVLLWHVSIAGYDGNCRFNIGYNDTLNLNNRHSNWSLIGYINEGRTPCKSDTFTMDSTPPNDYSGNWGLLFGVNCRGNLVGWYPTTTGHLEYLGENSLQPTDRLSNINPLWTTMGASVNDAGGLTAGGTNFALQAGSPARGLVNRSPLAFAIDGAARAGMAAHAGSRA